LKSNIEQRENITLEEGTMVSSSEETAIPVIFLNDDKEKTAKKLREVCIDVGFFYLEDHGVSESLVDSAFDQSKKLFDLSLKSKQNLCDKSMSRGFTAMNEETLDPKGQTFPDTKEGFYIARDVPKDDPRYNPAKLSGPNQWPSKEASPDMADPEAFRSTMEAYSEQLTSVANRVHRLLALALGLPETFFDAAFNEPMIALRLLHYANVKSRPEDGVLACGYVDMVDVLGVND
jgi:isopenicillin N synthase-like dioxygenase